MIHQNCRRPNLEKFLPTYLIMTFSNYSQPMARTTSELQQFKIRSFLPSQLLRRGRSSAANQANGGFTLVEQSSLRQQLRQRGLLQASGFCWQRTAAATRAVVEGLI